MRTRQLGNDHTRGGGRWARLAATISPVEKRGRRPSVGRWDVCPIEVPRLLGSWGAGSGYRPGLPDSEKSCLFVGRCVHVGRAV